MHRLTSKTMLKTTSNSTSKMLFTLMIGGLLVVDRVASAAAPETWQKHQQAVINHCQQISGLQNPQPAGNIISFNDDVSYDALLIRGNYAQPHMNNQVGQSLCLFNRKTRQAHASDADRLSRYTSRAGFQFTYPIGFVVEAKSFSGQTSDQILEAVELWTQRDYDGIKSRRAPGELPPHVSISRLRNPRRLALLDWVGQSNQFVSPQRVRSLTVAGQSAITFYSTGLYDSENVVLTPPNSTDVLVIRLEQVGRSAPDAVYRPAFQQIITSLIFTAQ
jgi:hypothetical protein